MTSKPEKVEEKKFVLKVEGIGGVCLKLQMMGSYGTAGYNDRLTLVHGPAIVFFEFKREDEEAANLQSSRHRKLKEMGFATYVVYTAKEAWELLIKEVARQTGHKIPRLPA